MNITPTSSAVNLMNSAQHKVADAAQKIAALPVKDSEIGSPDFNPEDIIKPVLSLNEAELENSAAVKILEADNTVKGSILDIFS